MREPQTSPLRGTHKTGLRTARKILAGLALSLLLAVVTLTCTNQDIVEVTNTASAVEIGILVDAADDSGNRNDLTFVSPFAMPVGFLHESSARNEIYALSKFRAPTLREEVPWTTAKDVIVFPMEDEIQIPITNWVVQGNFSTMQTNVSNEVTATQAIWDQERMGLALNSVTIVNATTDPDAGDFQNVRCSRAHRIRSRIGFTAGRINVYWVTSTGNNQTGRGVACGPGNHTILMGSNTFGVGLLAHEIGHQTSLGHIDGRTGFDTTNVMHSASSVRQFLTDGQVIRSHFRSGSAINSLYSARPGLPTRGCWEEGGSQRCPPRVKRIWADGTFPPN